MIIRPPAPDDWPSIGELAELLVRTHYAFDARRFVHPDTLQAPDYIDRLREEVERGHAMVRVADVDGRVAGYVFAGIEPGNLKELRPDAGYVHDLVVGQAHRGAGIGRALVASAVEWFHAHGIERVMLWTASSNTQAQQLFRDIGFTPTMIEMTLDRQ